MSHTTDMGITLTVLTVITTERGLLMPRPRLRLIPLFCTELMDTPMVLATTWAIMAMATLATPTPTDMVSPPPTPPLATPWPTLPGV